MSWLPGLTCFCQCMQILSELDLCALPGSLELNQMMADNFTAKVSFCCAAANHPSESSCDSGGGRAPSNDTLLSPQTSGRRLTSS